MSTPFLGNAAGANLAQLVIDDRFYRAAERPPINQREPLYDKAGIPIPGTEGVVVPRVQGPDQDQFDNGYFAGRDTAMADGRQGKYRVPDDYMAEVFGPSHYLSGYEWGYEEIAADRKLWSAKRALRRVRRNKWKRSAVEC